MSKTYNSKYRNRILEYFKTNSEVRLSAQEIYEHLREEGIPINLATVYRNLDKLSEEKVLSRHKMPEEDGHLYQYMKPEMACSEHLHLYCKKCGKIIHLNCEFMNQISSHLKNEHGFELDCSESMLVGICDDCLKKEGEKHDGYGS